MRGADNLGKDLLIDFAEPSAIIAVIMSLAEVAKQLGVPAKYIPILDVALGVIISVLCSAKEKGVMKSVAAGLAYGLSSCGAFSGVKNLIS